MSSNHPVIAVLLAAGEGVRYGERKQFIDLGGKPLLEHSLDTMQACSHIEHIFLVLPSRFPQSIDRMRLKNKLRKILFGGKTRFDSIRLSLTQLNEYPDDAYVLVHDAARPLVDRVLFERCVVALANYQAVTTAIVTTDSLGVGEDNCMRRILPRAKHFLIQTPQAARLGLLRKAYADFPSDIRTPNDDCEVILSYAPKTDIGIVEGDARNIKLTRAQDLALLKCLARQIGVLT